MKLDPHDPSLVYPSFWQRTLVGARRPLADLLRLQLYGVLWAATGIDQDIPESYTPLQKDQANDLSFHNLAPPHLTASDLAFDLLSAGVELARPAPLLLINEPMYRQPGAEQPGALQFLLPTLGL